MSTPTQSGSLGQIQLMAYVRPHSDHAVREAAQALGLTQVHVVDGGVVQAAAYLSEHASPEWLLVEIESAETAPAQLDALAEVTNPHTRVIVTGTVDSIRFYQWLNDLGIEGYLLQPFAAGELQQCIAQGRSKKTASTTADTDAPPKIIAVMGARGGVGTTTIATNLGAIAARDHACATAIIDLDPYFGTVALSLDLEPGRGLRDAFEKPERIDALFLERVMVKPFANLSIFSAEEPLMDALVTQPNAGDMMFAALREKFNVIVVDVPRQMNPLTRHILSISDRVVLVAEPQITSLRDSLRLKDYLVDHLKRAAPMLLLNRVGLSVSNELSPREFAKHLGQEMEGQIAHLPEIIAATAQGELLSHTAKLNAAAQPLRGIMHTILGAAAGDTPQKTNGGMFARLVGKS